MKHNVWCKLLALLALLALSCCVVDATGVRLRVRGKEGDAVSDTAAVSAEASADEPQLEQQQATAYGEKEHKASQMLAPDLIDEITNQLVPSNTGEVKAIDQNSHTRIIIMKNSNSLTLEKEQEHESRIKANDERKGKQLSEQLGKATRQEETKKQRMAEELNKKLSEQEVKDRESEEHLKTQERDTKTQESLRQEKTRKEAAHKSEQEAIQKSWVTLRWAKGSFNNYFSPNKASNCDSTGCYWLDGGYDAFDNWGHFSFTTDRGVGGTKHNLPMNLNGLNGNFVTNQINADGGQFSLKSGWVAPGIFAADLKQVGGEPMSTRLNFGGDYGADHQTRDNIERFDIEVRGDFDLTIPLWCHWTSANGLDRFVAQGGQPAIPQVVYCFLCQQVRQAQQGTPPFSVAHSAGNAGTTGGTVIGDKENVATIQCANGWAIFVNWGYAPINTVVQFISGQLKTVRNFTGQ